MLKKTIAGLAIGALFTKIAGEAISMASSLTEVQNVVDTAFGSMSWKVERFAKNAITQFGMSELSAKKTASTYMAMARGMGLTDDVASDMSITLAGLTGDVASFYNISQELADVKLKSIFTGETETLKDLGIVMTQTNLKQFALSQGITKNISDMTQAELTTLRYNYVLKQLSMAQGDFAKTSGSWANQLRILQEQFKHLLGIIGNGFIAVLTPVIRVINTVLSKVIELANVISGVFGKLFGYSNKKSGLSDVSKDASNASKAIGGVSDGLSNAGSTAKKASKEIKGALAGFDDLNILSDNSTQTDSLGSGMTGGYPIDAIDWGNTFNEPDTSGIDKAIDKVISKIEKLKLYLKNNIPSITSLMAGLSAGLLTFFGYKWLSKIGGLSGILVKILDIPGVQFLVTSLLGLFKGIPGFFTGIFSKIISVITASKLFGVIQSLFAPIITFLGGIFTSLSGIVSSGLSIITGLFSSALTTLGTIVSSIISCVMEMPVIGTILQTITGFVSSLVGWLGSLFSGITGVLGIIVSSPALLAVTVALIVAAIADLWMTSDEFRNNIIDALNNVKDIALNVWDNFIKPIFDAIIEICLSVWNNGLKPLWEAWKELVAVVITVVLNMWNSISPILSEILNILGTIFKQVISALTAIIKTSFNLILNIITICISSASGVIEGFFSTVKDVFGGIKQIFNGIITFIKGVFTGNWKQAWEGVKQIFKGIFDTLAGIVKAPINAVIGIVNGAISGINKVGFDVPDWVPFIGGKKFIINVPKIPYLAEGMIAKKATLGVFGEAGTEAVIPLKRNTQGLDMIAEKLAERIPISNTAGGTYVINLVMENGERLTRMVIKNIKEYEVKTGDPVFSY